jgi:TRAP-type C4-dicarboxylate transport system substrate-binding protein
VTRILLACGLAALALACAGCLGSGATKAGGTATPKAVVLTIENPDPGADDIAEYVETVERLSHGSIRFDIHSTSLQPGPVNYDRRVIADVRSGRMDAGKIAARTLDTVGVPDFQALVAPFLIDSLTLEQKVLASDLPARMLPAVSRLGVVGVALLPGAIRRPFGRRRAFMSLTDFRGARIGIRPSEVAAATFRALGGAGVPYPVGHLAGLDGAELDPGTLVNNAFELPGSSLTANVGLWPRPLVIVMRRRAYDGLAAAQRQVLSRAARAALATAIARLRADRVKDMRILCGRHLRIVRATPAAIAALHAAVQPVYGAVERDQGTKAAIGDIESLKRETGSAPDVEPGC